MTTQVETVYVGCRNTYEEIEKLFDQRIGYASSELTKVMRSAVRQVGITAQKKGRKLEFYEVNADKAELLHADGRTVLAAMFEVSYDPVVTIKTNDLNTILNETGKRYGVMDQKTYEVYIQELIDQIYEALKLVPEDEFLGEH